MLLLLSYSEETFSVFRLPPHVIIGAVTYIYLYPGFFIYISCRPNKRTALEWRTTTRPGAYASLGWVVEGCGGGLDIISGGEEKCIGRNSWPKCDRCACAASVDGRADFHGNILLLWTYR